MSNDYSKEKSAIATKILTLELEIQAIKEKSNGTARFLDIVNQYTDFKELTSEILNIFIEKIEIHQSGRIDGKIFQQVDIYFAHIGKIF